MLNQMKKILLGGGAALLLILPMVAGAQLGAPPDDIFDGFTRIGPPTAPGGITGPTGLVKLALDLLGWVQVFFWIAAVFFGLYAAFLYLTARGDSGKVSTANYMLIYTVVAIVVAVISYAIPAIVTGFITT